MNVVGNQSVTRPCRTLFPLSSNDPYKVLDSPNPCAECLAPKFAPEKTNCVITPLRNWASSCTNCVKIAAATLDYHLATDSLFAFGRILAISASFSLGKITRIS